MKNIKIKAVKYNKKGFLRARNTAPEFVLPKKDLNKSNINISVKEHYFKVEKELKASV
jgi:hypothetical protein